MLSPVAQSLVLFLALFSVPAASSLVNVTVDDQLGDPNTGLFPVYLPVQPPTWHAGSPMENCTGCKIQPYTLDLNQIHARTWHDATHTPPDTPATITVSFSGSAVYVFNIVPNSLPGTATFTNISFAIDGEHVYSFLHAPDPSSIILYNYPVYSNTTLQDGLHTLVMSAGGDTKSLVLFDYLIYTTESNATTLIPPTNNHAESSSSGARVGAIVGGVLGGVALAVLGVVIAVSCVRVRRRTRPQPTVRQINLTYGEDEDGLDGEDGWHPDLSGVHRGKRGSHAFFAQPTIPTASFFPITMRSLSRSTTHSPPHLASSGNYGPDPRPPHFDTPVEPTSTARWSSKRRAELTRRLEALHRRMSFLSSTTPSRSQVSDRNGTEMEIMELRAEIAELRRVLPGLSGHPGDGRGDLLPVYTAHQEST